MQVKTTKRYNFIIIRLAPSIERPSHHPGLATAEQCVFGVTAVGACENNLKLSIQLWRRTHFMTQQLYS